MPSLFCVPLYGFGTVIGGKSVRQADVSGGTHFPRKLCPTGQDIATVRSRITCPGLVE